MEGVFGVWVFGDDGIIESGDDDGIGLVSFEFESRYCWVNKCR